MPSAAPAEKLTSGLTVQMFDHDPGATTAIIVSPDGGTTKRVVDMRDVESLLVVAMQSVGTGGISEMEIVAATDSAMTTPVIIKTTGTVAADAVGDYVVLEISVEDLQAVSTADLRYAAGRLTIDTGTDEAVVTYIEKPKRSYSGLTANTIA